VTCAKIGYRTRFWQGRKAGKRSFSSGVVNPGLLRPTLVVMVSLMEPVTERLRNFLQYVALKLIDDPKQAQLKVAELAPKKVRFKLVLAQADVAMLIGRNGFTASAIRSVLKGAAEREGVQVSLQIHSHEEEAALLARNEES
jgi:predicted RNA-binding protein YlqC (UPF0109 family)